ncbi:MAG: InlB B-repeat-containing protein [Firmicutes bacterium]|nr:InlB B-repeat-containing protein [Bacillota bacterium]
MTKTCAKFNIFKISFVTVFLLFSFLGFLFSGMSPSLFGGRNIASATDPVHTITLNAMGFKTSDDEDTMDVPFDLPTGDRTTLEEAGILASLGGFAGTWVVAIPGYTIQPRWNVYQSGTLGDHLDAVWDQVRFLEVLDVIEIQLVWTKNDAVKINWLSTSPATGNDSVGFDYLGMDLTPEWVRGGQRIDNNTYVVGEPDDNFNIEDNALRGMPTIDADSICAGYNWSGGTFQYRLDNNTHLATGWLPFTDGVIISGEIWVRPVLTPNTTRTITFNPNGGSLAALEPGTRQVFQGQSIFETRVPGQLNTLPEDPTQAGFKFVRWYVYSLGGVSPTLSVNDDFDEGTVVDVAGNVTVFAEWTESTANFVFHKNHNDAFGDLPESFTRITNEAIISLDEMGKDIGTLERVGFHLLGFTLDDTGIMIFHENGDRTGNAMPRMIFEEGETFTLYALWVENTGTIEFARGAKIEPGNDPTGDLPANIPFTTNGNGALTTITIPSNFEKFGFRLLGFFDEYDRLIFNPNGTVNLRIADCTYLYANDIIDDELESKLNGVMLTQGGKIILTAKWAKNAGVIQFNRGTSFIPGTIDPTSSLPAVRNIETGEDLRGSNVNFGGYNITSLTMQGHTLRGLFLVSHSHIVVTDPIMIIDGSGEYVENFNGMLLPTDGAVFVLTALWQINQYTITFAERLGVPVSSITQNFYTNAMLPSAVRLPVEEGWHLAGWATSDDRAHNEFVDFELPYEWHILDDVTLYAVWMLNLYRIIFVDCDTMPELGHEGDEVEQYFRRHDHQIGWWIMPDTVSHLFSHWIVISTNAITGTVVGDTLTEANGLDFPAFGNTTLQAVYVVRQYTITFLDEDGDVIPSLTQTRNHFQTLFFIISPPKKGYTFVVWRIVSWEGNEVGIDAGLEYDIDDDFELTDELQIFGIIVFQVIWVVNPYMVSFTTNGDNEVDDIISNFGTNIIIPRNPIRSGYTFMGWAVVQNGPVVYRVGDFFWMDEDFDRTLHGIWTINTYHAQFRDGSGGIFASEQYIFNSVIAFEALEDTESHTFSHWVVVGTGAPFREGDTLLIRTHISFNPVFIIREHTITYFFALGGEPMPGIGDTLNHGEWHTITSTIPTRSGFTFYGWLVIGTESTYFMTGQRLNVTEEFEFVATWIQNVPSATSISLSGGVLTWSAVEGATSYRILANETIIAIVPAGQTSINITELNTMLLDGNYTLTVLVEKLINGTTHVSTFSNAVTYTVSGGPQDIFGLPREVAIPLIIAVVLLVVGIAGFILYKKWGKKKIEVLIKKWKDR